jgi:hypothetical protein
MLGSSSTHNTLYWLASNDSLLEVMVILGPQGV